MVLDITEEDIHVRGQKRKTRIVNIYDNKLEEGQTWQGPETRIRRAIEDFPWQASFLYEKFLRSTHRYRITNLSC